MIRLKSITWQDLLDLIDKAKSDLVLISPSIHEELTDVILSLSSHKGVQIWVCTDNSEENIRKGYGEIASISRLKDDGAEIREVSGLKISYLGIDGKGYLIFFESRILSNGPGGINAIVLEESESRFIELSFFENRFVELQDDVNTISDKLDSEKLQNTIELLKNQPPILPDLRREISVYNNHFQFVELALKGGNINATVVAIPPSALPFRSQAIKDRMNTRYKLFDKEDKGLWGDLTKINSSLSEIREKFLVPCSVRQGKSILQNSNKVDFELEIAQLKKLIAQSSEDLIANVQNAIEEAFVSLQKELEEFLHRYKLEFFPPELSPEMYENKVKMEVFRILQKVALPTASSLVKKLELSLHYYDLTWEDTKSDELINWFKEKELLTQEFKGELATVKSAYEVER